MEAFPNTPLNQHQREILKLFTRDMDESDLLAVKRLIVGYLAEKATRIADEVWEEKGWTNEDMHRLLNMHMRKSSDSKHHD